MPSPKTNQPNRPQKSKFWALVELLFQGLWKHRLLYLALILLVMCSTSFVMYHLKARTAKMMIALNYEEATRGLYPNNTRFNISLIKSDDVLDRAIAKAGLEGQVTAQDMAENITAWASNVNGMQLPSDTTSYKIATTYTITYEKNDEIGPRISARDMLGLMSPTKRSSTRTIPTSRWASPPIGPSATSRSTWRSAPSLIRSARSSTAS